MNYAIQLLIKKNRASIILLWFFGLLMILFLIVPSFKLNIVRFIFAKNIDTVQLSVIKNAAVTSKLNPDPFLKSTATSNAFVFVNINKKHFLTRFASFVSNEEMDIMEKNLNTAKKSQQNVLAIKRISSGAKQKYVEKNKEDFFIKPVPR